MCRKYILLLVMMFAISFGQYDYNLEDLNSSSEFYGQNVGTSYFTGNITLHYFGHYN